MSSYLVTCLFITYAWCFITLDLGREILTAFRYILKQIVLWVIYGDRKLLTNIGVFLWMAALQNQYSILQTVALEQDEENLPKIEDFTVPDTKVIERYAFYFVEDLNSLPAKSTKLMTTSQSCDGLVTVL
jgi:hypothetical protein